MISQEVLNSRLFYLNQLPEVAPENQRHLERYKKFIRSRGEYKNFSCTEIEKHHICPKTLGGKDVDDNIIILTYREHYIAHLMLWKCGYRKMIYAFWMISNKNKNSSKIYKRIRESFSKEMKDSSEERIQKFKNTIQSRTEDEKQKNKIACEMGAVKRREKESEDAKKLRYEKMKLTMQTKTEDERKRESEIKSKNAKAMWAKRSLEDKKLIGNKIAKSRSYENKNELEVITEHINRSAAAKKYRAEETPEEKQIHHAKIEESKRKNKE